MDLIWSWHPWFKYSFIHNFSFVLWKLVFLETLYSKTIFRIELSLVFIRKKNCDVVFKTRSSSCCLYLCLIDIDGELRIHIVRVNLVDYIEAGWKVIIWLKVIFLDFLEIIKSRWRFTSWKKTRASVSSSLASNLWLQWQDKTRWEDPQIKLFDLRSNVRTRIFQYYFRRAWRPLSLLSPVNSKEPFHRNSVGLLFLEKCLAELRLDSVGNQLWTIYFSSGWLLTGATYIYSPAC
jgi:hypothetical protein